MAIPAALMLIGTATQMIGQWTSNADQAVKERQNEKFYGEQAAYARLSAIRAEALAGFSYSAKVGQQIGAYASGGVDSSGSAALTLAGTLHNALDEIWAIKQKGDMDVKLARMRGIQSGQNADTLSSTGYNAMQAGSTALGAYTKSEGFGQGFPSFLSPKEPPPSGQGGGLKYFPKAERE